MPRKTFAALLPFLAVLALSLPEKAVAGPPEGVSGKMVLAPDEVADGLRKYRGEKDDEKRFEWLRRLAATHDPRVAVTLGEMLGCAGKGDRLGAAILIAGNFGAKPQQRCYGVADAYLKAADAWWKENEADLRRRAKQLPQ